MKSICLKLFLLFLLTIPTLACPFCAPGESDIFGDVVGAQAVVLVQKIDTRKYKVLNTLLGPVKPGRVVVAAEPQGKLGKQGHLLLTTAGPPNLPYWSDVPRVLNDRELAFAKASLQKRSADPQEQWDFAAKHLEDSSSEIASAAYNLLASAPLLEVQKRRNLVGQAKLSGWSKNTKLAPERRALYLLMGYPGFGQADAAWIAEQLFSPQLSPTAPHLGPLAVAYLHLKGAPGVQEITKRFYTAGAPASKINPLNRALTLVYEHSKDQNLKAAIRKLFNQELQHAQRGAFVLAPLALWQDYSSAARVETLFKSNSNVIWVKVAVIRYFRSFQSAQAQAALGRLSSVDAELVRRTTDPYRRADLGVD